MSARPPCPTGKIRYPTRTRAARILRVTRERAGRRPYLCPHCHGWHLTRQDVEW